MTNPNEKSKPREWIIFDGDSFCPQGAWDGPQLRVEAGETEVHVVEYSAYTSALEQIAKLESLLKNLRQSLGLIGGMTIDEVVTGYINKNGGPIDEIDQALAELKKWRGG